jgi:diguanylate cyclase (GGDEF)-like protein
VVINDILSKQMLVLKFAKRNAQQLAFILIDLDLFKKINDNFGHQAGDYVLSEFAKFLKNCFRDYDYIFRYGGINMKKQLYVDLFNYQSLYNY